MTTVERLLRGENETALDLIIQQSNAPNLPVSQKYEDLSALITARTARVRELTVAAQHAHESTMNLQFVKPAKSHQLSYMGLLAWPVRFSFGRKQRLSIANLGLFQINPYPFRS